MHRKPEARKIFVRQAYSSDQRLLREVESLLSSHDSAESFLETPAVAKLSNVFEAETKRLEPGTCFCHFKIAERISAGGMGDVYLLKIRNFASN